MYDLDNEPTTKERFEEICDLRQPIVFSIDNFSISRENILNKNSVHEIKIRNVKDVEYNSLPLSLSNAVKLFENDTNETYLSEINGDFLKETGLFKEYKKLNSTIQPMMNCYTAYDFLIGSSGVETPLRYNLNYRNFYTVSEGNAKIKLFPPTTEKYVEPTSDYENFEFRSSGNISAWNLPEKIKDKVKSIDFILTPGKAVYIPAYWWFSIKLEKNAIVSSFQYRTYMNYLAILPNICMFFLQQLNIKRETVKKADVVMEKNKLETDIEERI
jgi:hypothetical protein